MHYEMGRDHDYQGLGMREERALDVNKVDSLNEAKKVGVLTESAMVNLSVGMQSAFPDFLVSFGVLGLFLEWKLFNIRQGRPCCNFYCTR